LEEGKKKNARHGHRSTNGEKRVEMGVMRRERKKASYSQATNTFLMEKRNDCVLVTITQHQTKRGKGSIGSSFQRNFIAGGSAVSLKEGRREKEAERDNKGGRVTS
jgi:hypothetical protein